MGEDEGGRDEGGMEGCGQQVSNSRFGGAEKRPADRGAERSERAKIGQDCAANTEGVRGRGRREK